MIGDCAVISHYVMYNQLNYKTFPEAHYCRLSDKYFFCENNFVQ